MSRRLPILFILTTVAIDAMGFGLILPVMPDLIQEVSGNTLADAAIWGGILTTAFAVTQFLCGPLIGSISDRFGRRPVLLISLLVMAADYLVMAVAGSIWLLLVGRLVGGVTSATYATASAYMADISKPDEKARNFGLIGVGFGVGFVLGPLLGGVLAEVGTRTPFYVAAVLALSNTVLGYFVLKETVTDAIRRPFSWLRANPLGALYAIGKLPELTKLLIVFFFYEVAVIVYVSVWPYYATELFQWSPAMLGLSFAIYGGCYALSQGLLVAPSIRLLGTRGTVSLGLWIETASLVFFGMATNGMLVLLMIPITALGAIGIPALQAVMSRRVGDDAQGELQGVLASLTSLATIISPILMTQAFARFSETEGPYYAPGAPFLFSALVMLCATVIFLTSRRRT
ncbi:TCR/Tet family MFS transporter [Shimia litoralis]|uniref:TCR/Tet family MFS transporter n=2 Tax=Shimia litoralis TaxID=420403 RepID=A0A4U7N9V9_9RHOB|nr:TCR/Tet family MFS transporter [Shimia litoralis]TKZ22668.1 TCR/Tet family MFS transporter [Shimia litoralis]